MAFAGTLGAVTVDDQRSHIKIETLRGKTLTETHIGLLEVSGEQMDHGKIPHWATCFHEGRVTINDNPIPGRVKTSTDESSVKLVADFLAENCSAMCEEISQGTRISPTLVFVF
jgi:hypothetical protein